MKTSDKGIALIERFEGCKLKAYRCPANVLTIGIGHTTAAGSPTVHEGMEITREEAHNILRLDLAKVEVAVANLVKVKLNQHQFDALVSFAYNCGNGALAKSGLLRRVNAGEFESVPDEFMKWTRGGGRVLPGLVKRRQAEAALFMAHDDIHDTDESRVEPELPKASKAIHQSKEGNAAVVAGGAGALAVVGEVMPVVKEGGDILSSLSPSVLALVVCIGAAVAIWYWRKRRLDEEAA